MIGMFRCCIEKFNDREDLFLWKLENFPGVAVSIQGLSPLPSLDFDIVVWTDVGESARGAPVCALKIEDVDNDVLEVEGVK
jgi:hypothetical protein